MVMIMAVAGAKTGGMKEDRTLILGEQNLQASSGHFSGHEGKRSLTLVPIVSDFQDLIPDR